MKIVDSKISLKFNSESILADFTSEILKRIEGHPIYKQINLVFLNNKKIKLYFWLCIKSEIKKYVLQFVAKKFVGDYEIKKDEQKEVDGIWLPADGIFLLLKECWHQDEVPIKYSKIKQIIYSNFSVYLTFKRIIQYKLQTVFNFINRYLCRYDFSSFDKTQANIAVRYNEGFDTERRSDIVWWREDLIKKSRILICIGANNKVFKRKYKLIDSFDKQTAVKLKEMGVQWVCIPRGLLLNSYRNCWIPSKNAVSPFLKYLKKQKTDTIGNWIIRIGEKLIREVELWKNFYETFNIKIFFESGEGSPQYIAQGIAFDILNKDRGITVGKQRSDSGDNPEVFSGYFTKDIFFTWNYRQKECLNPEFNIVSSQVIAGYPNDKIFYNITSELENIKNSLMENGARFIIALFDTAFTDSIGVSSHEVGTFYKYFLNWVLEQESIGLVIKSKKPYLLKGLKNISSLLKAAVETGRCVKLNNEYGRLPSDASKIADFAVGMGVSSALTEAVIAGCRGIHFFNGFPKYHDYYKWGYGKLVFDDLDKMIKALKSYKDNPEDNPDLGDWTPYLDLLDPFRDGRAGERMGLYLKWCLEGYDAGLSRDEVLNRANSMYVSKWGEDKVVKF